jgi:hypothetical protein
MMQNAISTGAHWLDRVVTTPAISGSIAGVRELEQQHAAGKDQQRTLAQQMEHAGGFLSGTSRTTAPVALSNVDLLLPDPGERQQCRDREHEGHDKHCLVRQQ